MRVWAGGWGASREPPCSYSCRLALTANPAKLRSSKGTKTGQGPHTEQISLALTVISRMLVRTTWADGLLGEIRPAQGPADRLNALRRRDGRTRDLACD